MRWIKEDINLDFMGARKKAFFLSLGLVVLSLLVLMVQGLNLGIDFKGGSSLIVAFDDAADVDRDRLESSVATLVAKELGVEGTQVSVQDFDSGTQSVVEGKPAERFLIYTEVTSLISPDKRAQIISALQQQLGEGARIDVPAEGADVFDVRYPAEGPIGERVTQLQQLFAGLGYTETSIESGYEKEARIACIKDLNMLLEDAARERAGDGLGDDPQIAYRQCEERVTQEASAKQDTRFTVTVEELKGKVTEQLAADFAGSFIAVESSTSVSPSVGQDLLANGLLAVLYAIIGILIYITLRFDFRFAPGAVVALVHDVIITMGIFALLQVKFSLPIIAALLTIVGYSLNDTIVVFDRVRETFDAYRGRDMKELLNRAINSTLSRTSLTSVTTLLVVVSILLLGGGLIRDFALALLIGVVVGTYSSIFVASPLVYYTSQYMERREADKAKSGRGDQPKPARA